MNLATIACRQTTWRQILARSKLHITLLQLSISSQNKRSAELLLNWFAFYWLRGNTVDTRTRKRWIQRYGSRERTWTMPSPACERSFKPTSYAVGSRMTYPNKTLRASWPINTSDRYGRYPREDLQTDDHNNHSTHFPLRLQASLKISSMDLTVYDQKSRQIVRTKRLMLRRIVKSLWSVDLQYHELMRSSELAINSWAEHWTHPFCLVK